MTCSAGVSTTMVVRPREIVQDVSCRGLDETDDAVCVFEEASPPPVEPHPPPSPLTASPPDPKSTEAVARRKEGEEGPQGAGDPADC